MDFGFNKHPHNHIHNIKPLVALPSYSAFSFTYLFSYTNPAQGVTKTPDLYRDYSVRWDINTENAVANNTRIHLAEHTFDNDSTITELTAKYELRCLMRDDTIETKLIEEFDLMPYKIGSVIDDMNHFMFKRDKVYFLSDIQPNFKNMFKATVQWTQTSSTATGNENVLVVSLFQSHDMKETNDAIIAAATQT